MGATVSIFWDLINTPSQNLDHFLPHNTDGCRNCTEEDFHTNFNPIEWWYFEQETSIRFSGTIVEPTQSFRVRPHIPPYSAPILSLFSTEVDIVFAALHSIVIQKKVSMTCRSVLRFICNSILCSTVSLVGRKNYGKKRNITFCFFLLLGVERNT